MTNLFSAASRAYSIGPSVSWRLFDAGAVRKNIEVQSALQEQALIQYEATLLTALEEVENALVAFGEERRRREALREATLAAERAVALAQAQYGAGIGRFSECAGCPGLSRPSRINSSRAKSIIDLRPDPAVQGARGRVGATGLSPAAVSATGVADEQG